MKEYEIWIGTYSLGQGYPSPIEPEKLAEIKATSFKVACVLYEHQNAIQSLKQRMNRGDFMEDMHLGKWYYHSQTNSNSWTGKYYETQQEAKESFK